ncbi:PKD domain-containing protein [Bdellovibrionota bacterium]
MYHCKKKYLTLFLIPTLIMAFSLTANAIVQTVPADQKPCCWEWVPIGVVGQATHCVAFTFTDRADKFFKHRDAVTTVGQEILPLAVADGAASVEGQVAAIVASLTCEEENCEPTDNSTTPPTVYPCGNPDGSCTPWDAPVVAEAQAPHQVLSEGDGKLIDLGPNSAKWCVENYQILYTTITYGCEVCPYPSDGTTITEQDRHAGCYNALTRIHLGEFSTDMNVKRFLQLQEKGKIGAEAFLLQVAEVTLGEEIDPLPPYDFCAEIPDGEYLDTCCEMYPESESCGTGGGGEFTCSATASSAGGGMITFTGIAADPSGGALMYMWDFGDGSTGMGETVTYFYGAEGDYTVTLTVVNEASEECVDSFTITVTPG